MTPQTRPSVTQAIATTFAIGALLFSQSPFASTSSLLETLREERSDAGQAEKWIDAVESDAALRKTLASGGPLTLFVPNDKAFEELYALAECGAIQLNGNLLSTLLNHHVVRTTTDTAGAGAKREVRTRLGAPISIAAEEVHDTGGAAARFDGPAIEATNGVAHVIDRFLWPYPAPTCS